MPFAYRFILLPPKKKKSCLLVSLFLHYEVTQKVISGFWLIFEVVRSGSISNANWLDFGGDLDTIPNSIFA